MSARTPLTGRASPVKTFSGPSVFAFGGAITKVYIEQADSLALDALSGRINETEALARIRVKLSDLRRQMEAQS